MSGERVILRRFLDVRSIVFYDREFNTCVDAPSGSHDFRPVGFIQENIPPLIGKESLTLCTIFVPGLSFLINGKAVELSDSTVLSIRSIFPFVKRLAVDESGQRVFSFTYLSTSFFLDGFNHKEILDYVPWLLKLSPTEMFGKTNDWKYGKIDL